MPASPILASGRNVHHAAAKENGGCRKAMSSGDEGLTGKGRHVPRRSLCRRSPGTTATQAKNWQASSATEYRRSVNSSRPASSTRWHSSTLENPPQTKTLTRSFYSDSGNEVMGSSYKTLKLITY